MMKKVQVYIIGCLVITMTSLYIYNSYTSYVIPVPSFNLHRSTNDTVLRNIEVIPSSYGNRVVPLTPTISRILAKVDLQSDIHETKGIGTATEEVKSHNITHPPHGQINGTEKVFSGNLGVAQQNVIGKENETIKKSIFSLKNTSELIKTATSKYQSYKVNVTSNTSNESVRSIFWARYGKTSSCGPSKQNIAFIKTHKTGSTTLGHLINRFGFHYRLSFVLNKHSRGNGHLVYYNVTKDSPRLKFLPPIGVRMRDYKNYKYNLIAIHVRYNRKVMDSFMKPDTKYITIIRDPGSQFESAFSHFQFDDAFPLNERRKFNTTEEKLEHFFKKPMQYRDRLMLLSWENMLGLRWFYARNNQAFDLGLDHKYHMNPNVVDKFINRLEREMTVVLLTEFLDESLLILRKKMCWTWNDILYIAKNRRPKVETLPDLLREKMRSWNAVDTMLYNHFNRTLWKQVAEYGPDFENDLAFFKEMLNQVFTECVSNQYQKSQGRNFHWVEYKPRSGASIECKLLVESKRTLFRKIWARQDIMRSMLLSDRTKLGGFGTTRRRPGYYNSRARYNIEKEKRGTGMRSPVSGRARIINNSRVLNSGNVTENKRSNYKTSSTYLATTKLAQRQSLLTHQTRPN